MTNLDRVFFGDLVTTSKFDRVALTKCFCVRIKLGPYGDKRLRFRELILRSNVKNELR